MHHAVVTGNHITWSGQQVEKWTFFKAVIKRCVPFVKHSYQHSKQKDVFLSLDTHSVQEEAEFSPEQC